MNLLRKIQYCQYWNIGFCDQTPESLIHDKALKPIQWLKHPYHDRWFADPFILKVSETEIVVFVEECTMENPKGIISELVIDRKTMALKRHYVLLQKETHLSYPAIIRHSGKILVYPENGASGKLNIYEYDAEKHQLINPICILNEAVADATIIEQDGLYYLSATKFPDTQEKAYLYESNSPYGPFLQIDPKPYQTNLQFSRQGGNFFEVQGHLYRPVQDCMEQYGAALNIMETNGHNEKIKEFVKMRLSPQDKRYGLGLHTLNFENGMAVIDGYGYYKPVLGKWYYFMRKLISRRFSL